MKKHKFKWIILIVLIAVATALLVLAIRGGADGTAISGDFLTSRTGIPLLVCIIAVPLLLLSLLLTIAFAKPDAPTVIAAPIVQQGESDAEAESEEEEAFTERFNKLTAIDAKGSAHARLSYDRDVTLESFCNDLRAFAAAKRKLYYSIDDIRRFVAGMAVSHILILQGMSGTGKTSLARVFGEFVDNPSTIIPVQPMWKERTDLVGYYNEFTKRFNETLLLEKMYEARYNRDIYITVLDEMNIARVEYYFAEFLSLLELPEKDEWRLDVVADSWPNDPKYIENGRFLIPSNMWFIGTANNDDSTFAISDKVYDRAMILNLDTKSDPFTAELPRHSHLSAEQFEELKKNAIASYGISQKNLQRLADLDAALINMFSVTFGNRIMKQIREYVPVYVACGGDELDALDDILAKKIMRKIETQNPIHIHNRADDLLSKFTDLFGEDRMPLCRERIRRMAGNS